MAALEQAGSRRCRSCRISIRLLPTLVCRCERVPPGLKPDAREAGNQRANGGYAGWPAEKRRASNSTGINFRPSSDN